MPKAHADLNAEIEQTIAWSRTTPDDHRLPCTLPHMLRLFTGTDQTAPCYRLHLAQAIAERVKPRTVDELCERVYPPNQPEPPAEALELLCAAYDTWRERRGR